MAPQVAVHVHGHVCVYVHVCVHVCVCVCVCVYLLKGCVYFGSRWPMQKPLGICVSSMTDDSCAHKYAYLSMTIPYGERSSSFAI